MIRSGSSSWRVRVAVGVLALALSSTSTASAQPEPSVPELVRVVGDPAAPEDARAEALWRLAELGPAAAAALPAVLDALAEPELERTARYAIREIGPGDGDAFLRVVRRYPEGGRHAFDVLYGLLELGPAGLAAAPAAVEALAVPYSHETGEYVRAARDALVAMGPAVLPTLEAALADPRANVREWVYVVLGRLGPASAVEPLLTAGLRDPSPSGRRGAVRGFEELYAEAEVRPLVDALGAAAADPTVRADVARALCRRFEDDPPRIGTWFRRFVRDDSPHVRSTAVEALRRESPSHPEVFAALVDAVRDPDDWTRRQVEHALTYVGEEDARRGVARWWVVPRAFWRPAVLTVALTLAWLALAARFPARRPHGAWRWTAQLAWTATVPLALACGGVAYATTRPWTTDFLPQPRFGLVSFPVAATGTTAFVVLLAAVAVCARKPAPPSEPESP